MPEFRLFTPTRSCDTIYATHSKYKKYLVIDFSNRCGYCDGHDRWYGGYKVFHIDHFAPKDKFPELKAVYANLIYACPSCNGAKANKWPSDNSTVNIVSDKGFLNPITDDFNIHFSRDNFSNIIGLSNIAKDMIISLNLSLERHSVLWMLTRFSNIISEYKTALVDINIDLEKRKTLEEAHYLLLKAFNQYLEKLKLLNE